MLNAAVAEQSAPCKKQGMRKLLVVLVLIACVTHLADAQKARPGRFPFLAFDYVDNPRVLESMHHAGITSVAYVRPKMLDACAKYDLQCLIFDERLSGNDWSAPFDGKRFLKNLPVVAREVANHPALYGFHVRDEPSQGEFEELAKAVAAVKEVAPGKWPYINLFPGDGTSYDDYLETFVNTVHPTALSYDRYSITQDAGNGEIETNFWTNLAQVRSAAVRHRLPMWNIVLSSPHWRYRDLTEADIRLQVWGSLAYGVTGISYYKFVSKEIAILNVDDLGNWRGGPLDQFEEKTPTWYWVRDVNRQIQNIAPVFLKLRSDDVYHFGSVPELNHGPSEQSLVKSLPAGDFVVGDFTGENGKHYALVVNKSLKHSVHCDPHFNGNFKSVSYVSPRTGEVKPYPAKYYWLAPGQGVLLELQTE